MKKAFTLIELLAVIVILGIIATIATPIVLKSINNGKNKAYNVQINEIIKATKDWALINSNCIANNGTTIIKLGRLKYGSEYSDSLNCPNDEGGFVDINIKDPKTNDKFDDEFEIKITSYDESYYFEVNE